MKHILVLDGLEATATLGALTLQRANREEPTGTGEVDSCAPLKRIGPQKGRYKPWNQAGQRAWDGIDPSYDDTRQYDGEEALLGPEEAVRRAIIRHPALVTVDGMQLYCFRARFPYRPGQEQADPHGQDPNHLEYWLRRMQEQLGNGEKLDAIVIPPLPDRKAYAELTPFLVRAKEANPTVKLVMIQDQVSASTEHLPLIDAVVTPQGMGDAIRNLLAMPALPPRDPLREFHADREASRAIKKSQQEQYRGQRYDHWREQIKAKSDRRKNDDQGRA